MLSVGWLELGREYTRGNVAPEVVAKLRDLMNYATGMSLGSHYCEFCMEHKHQRARWHGIAHGSVTLSVPGSRAVYETPQLVIHYIEAHGYQPPLEFCEAVLACPPGWTDAYFRAIHPDFAESPEHVERMRQYTACAICAAMANSPAESAEDRERFVRYAHLVMSAPSLTNPDRAVLVESADDAQPPIDPLVHAHLASMIRICKEHESRGPRLIELIGEGHAALSRARLTFDAVRDGDFAVYASSRIRETLELAIAEHGRNPNEVAERDDGAAFRLGPRH
jgi:hypothetical protein